MKVTAIFDVGRTNKKFFLFDTQYQLVYKEYTQFEEIRDEEGFPCDDLATLCHWMKSCLERALLNDKYEVQAVNISSYGASFVHVGHEGKPVAPLYNYLKPFPKELLASFYQKYGDSITISKETASPPLGMLNSGLQLYWLKYAKPEVFSKIRWSMHLPQFLSFLFSGIPLSEYTSIGCHTCLWDYAKNDYHHWVYAEEIHMVLPPIVNTSSINLITFGGKQFFLGAGIHDSSSALLPYVSREKDPFLLISTGTWSICMNPFNYEILTVEDLEHDCLNFLLTDGKPIKASRVFLGNEYSIQTEILRDYYNKGQGYHKSVRFDNDISIQLHKNYQHYFHFESISLEREQPTANVLSGFKTYEEAFHQLMMELVELQVSSAERAIGSTPVSKIYVDGGFADNEIYIKLLERHFDAIEVVASPSPLGSALGAAIVISDKERIQI